MPAPLISTPGNPLASARQDSLCSSFIAMFTINEQTSLPLTDEMLEEEAEFLDQLQAELDELYTFILDEF